MSKRGGGALLSGLTWAIGLIFFFPVFWMVLTSFKQERDAYTDTPSLFFTPTLDQYSGVFDSGFWPYLGNSAFATFVSTLLVISLAIPAAYSLSIRPVKKTQDVLFF
ncbi:MAG: sugB 2, partial [Nocardioidaceae bacterium]|nr:sugB 2 [Nocardioidaceae bacterium]